MVVVGSLVFNIGYIFLTNVNEMYFFNRTENQRRKSLLKESFGVNTTLKETNKYYNNNEKHSIVKLGLNCYESAFFTKKIVDKMMPGNILKFVIIITIYVILMIKLEDMNLLLVITQTVFSSEIILYFIKLCYYKFQLDKVCKDFENIYFKIGLQNKDINVLILDTTMDYECLKSYCKILISSKIFFDNNDKWSKEWQKLLKKIKRTG